MATRCPQNVDSYCSALLHTEVPVVHDNRFVNQSTDPLIQYHFLLPVLYLSFSGETSD